MASDAEIEEIEKMTEPAKAFGYFVYVVGIWTFLSGLSIWHIYTGQVTLEVFSFHTFELELPKALKDLRAAMTHGVDATNSELFSDRVENFKLSGTMLQVFVAIYAFRILCGIYFVDEDDSYNKARREIFKTYSETKVRHLLSLEELLLVFHLVMLGILYIIWSYLGLLAFGACVFFQSATFHIYNMKYKDVRKKDAESKKMMVTTIGDWAMSIFSAGIVIFGVVDGRYLASSISGACGILFLAFIAEFCVNYWQSFKDTFRSVLYCVCGLMKLEHLFDCRAE